MTAICHRESSMGTSLITTAESRKGRPRRLSRTRQRSVDNSTALLYIARIGLSCQWEKVGAPIRFIELIWPPAPVCARRESVTRIRNQGSPLLCVCWLERAFDFRNPRLLRRCFAARGVNGATNGVTQKEACVFGLLSRVLGLINR